MITAIVIKKNHSYYSFECNGHSGYAKRGQDIVCSAVSMLTTNTINSIEKLTDCDFKGESADGRLYWEFPDGCTKDASLLMDSMILGLEAVSDEYGKKFLTLELKEV